MTQLRSGFDGNFVVEVYRDEEGPANFVPGRGVDSVPRSIGTGRLQIRYAIQGRGEKGEDALLRFSGLSLVGVQAVRARVEELQGADGTGEVTKEAVWKSLRA